MIESQMYFFRHSVYDGCWLKRSFCHTKCWSACQALSIRKNDPYALVARARTYAKMGIVKESLDDVNTVLKEDPDNHQVCCCSRPSCEKTRRKSSISVHGTLFDMRSVENVLYIVFRRYCILFITPLFSFFNRLISDFCHTFCYTIYNRLTDV